MSSKKPHSPLQFRRTQSADPVTRTRRYGKWKDVKKAFDIFVTDIGTGDEFLAVTVYAKTSREAIRIGREKLRGCALMNRIEHAAYSAVEVID